MCEATSTGQEGTQTSRVGGGGGTDREGQWWRYGEVGIRLVENSNHILESFRISHSDSPVLDMHKHADKGFEFASNLVNNLKKKKRK